MSKEIESRLNKISVKPLSEEEKCVLWSKIEKNMTSPEKSPYWSSITSKFSAFRLQTGIAFSLMVAVLFGSTGIAFAYADSAKPGDMFFPVSALKEKIVISLTPTKNQDEVILKYAQKRIEQGNKFLTALNTSVVTSTSTRTLAGAIAVSTTATNYHINATSSPVVVKDAVNHLSATIVYLQGVKADMIQKGNTPGAQTVQNAIDKIVEQVGIAGNQNDFVVAKVQEHKNQFNVVVRTKNASTTTTTKLDVNTKKDTQKVIITEKENTQVKKVEELQKKENLKKEEIKKDEEKKAKQEYKKQEENKKNEEKNSNSRNEKEDNKKDNGFFGWLGLGKKTNICHQGTNISFDGSAVKAHLAHGDVVGTCTASTTPSTTDTTAPVISNIVNSVTTTTAKITWNTNENTAGKIYYGKTSPIVIGNASYSIQNTSYATDHTFDLSGLSTSTTYYFILEGKDNSGNVGLTSEKQFTTAS